MSDFEDRLSSVLERHVDGFRTLVSAERLSGGASQETYRVRRSRRRRRAQAGAPSRAGRPHRRAGHRAPGPRAPRPTSCAARATPAFPSPRSTTCSSPRTASATASSWSGSRARRWARASCAREELAAVRPRLAYQCGEILARIHAIDLDGHRPRPLLGTLTPGAVRRADLGALPQLRDAAADDRLRGALAARPAAGGEPAARSCTTTSATATSWCRAPAWSPCSTGRPRSSAIRCATSAGSAPTRGASAAAICRSAASVDYEDLFAGYEAVSGRTVDPDRVKWWEVFGSFWWAVGCLGMAQVYRTGPDRTVERPAIGRRSSECQVDCVNLLIPGPVELIEPQPVSSRLDMPRSDELLRQRARLPPPGRDAGDHGTLELPRARRRQLARHPAARARGRRRAPPPRARAAARVASARAATTTSRRCAGGWCTPCATAACRSMRPASPSICARPWSIRWRSISPSTRDCAPRSSRLDQQAEIETGVAPESVVERHEAEPTGAGEGR